jgi:hypothetical protein
VSRSIRRGAVAATIALALFPLAACASGGDAATHNIKPKSAHTSAGDIKIQNLALVTGDPKVNPTDVSLGGSLINNGPDDELTKVTLDGAAGPATLPGGSVALPKGAGRFLAPKPAGTDLADYVGPALFKGTKGVLSGDYKKVTFFFKNAGEVTVEVAVHGPDAYFEQLKPAAPQVLPPAPVQSSPAALPSNAPASGAPSSGAPSNSASSSASGAATH